MNGQMENLPILQDFVPYQGRCPKSSPKASNSLRFPCPALLPQFSWGEARQRPQYGMKSCRKGRFSVHLSVCPSVHPSPLWAIQPVLRPSKPGLRLALRLGLRPGWMGLRSGWMAPRGDKWGMKVWTNGKSPHFTELCPLSGPLPKKL
jgi:hypothetical protein